MRQRILVFLLACACNSSRECSLPPGISPTFQATPSTEMTRGEPGSLQFALYDAPQSLLLIRNDDDSQFVTVSFQGEPLTIAPTQSFARIHSFVSHVLHVHVLPLYSVNISMSEAVHCLAFHGTRGFAPFSPCQDDDVPPAELSPILPQIEAKAIKVKNLSSRRFNRFWIPAHGPPVYNGVVEPQSIMTTNSYISHVFRFMPISPSEAKVAAVFEFRVTAEEEIYAYVDVHTADPQLLRAHQEELLFAQKYREFFHYQRSWIAYYPHLPARTFMWPAEYIGQEYVLPLFTLKVMSIRPRVFMVDDFLSQDECQLLIEQAQTQLGDSSVEMVDEKGRRVATNTRTSTNAWLFRNHKTDEIFRRVALLLNLPDRVVSQDAQVGRAENMQVVHYAVGQQYVSHHDWGVRNSPNTRFATVLLYLNEPLKGGQTSFPKARVGNPEGLVVTPRIGRAVLFYSQFPDGNCDDESLHEARAVIDGEKWLANVWLHDKRFV